MSFNNHLAFNISKSSATTSTTSATSTSATADSTSKSNSKPGSSSENNTINSVSSVNKPGQKSQLIHGILSSSISASQSPKFVGSATLSDAAPTVVTYGNETIPTSADSSNSKKTDLIGLFGKFDVSDKETGPAVPNEDEERDYVEQKFDSFKPTNSKPQESTVEKDTVDANNNEADTSTEVEKSPDNTIIEKVAESIDESSLAPVEEPTEEEVGQVEQQSPKIDASVEEQVTKIESQSTEEASNEQAKTETETTERNELEEQTQGQHEIIDEIEEDNNSAVEVYQLTEEEITTHNKGDKQDSDPVSTRPDAWSRTRSRSQVNINPAAQYQQSHKPFNFHVFLSQLKMKSADPISRYIKSFLLSFNKQAIGFTLQQKAKVVRDFKVFMSEKFTLYEPFASMDETALENAREGLEKLLMNRIYDHCFPPEIVKNHGNTTGMVTNDLEDDASFDDQLEKFSWVNGSHLEVDVEKFASFRAKRNGEEYNFMGSAVKEINKVNSYRAPRDKVICILEACKNIFWYLKVNKQETNADEFIPILIYVIIKAKVPHLISNVHYIENFRGLEWLNRGETSYYLSSIEGAISFIQNLSFDDLCISQEEYDAHMEAWEANERIKKEQRATQVIPIQSAANTQSRPDGLSPSSVLMTSAGMFAKSLTQLLSPSPDGTPQDDSAPIQRHSQSQTQGDNGEPDATLLKTTYDQLKEIFPDLDEAVLKDIIYMNKGDMDSSLDACLQIVNDT